MAVVTLEEYRKQQEEEEKKKKKKEKNNTLSIIDYTEREYSYDFDDVGSSNTAKKSKNTNNSLIKKAQKGNVLQQIGGTIGDVATNVGEGFFNTIEGVTDFGQNAIASAIGLVAGQNNKASNWLRNNANVNSTGAIFGTNERNDENLFKKGWTDELDKYSVSGNILDSVAQGAGQIGAYVGLAGAGGGAGATASKGGLLTRTGLSSAKATALSTFASSYGNTLSTMRNAGYDDREARTQALVNGLSETISEQFFDGIPGLKTAGWGDKLTGKIRNSVGRYLGSTAGMFTNSIINALSEGSEEVLSNIFTTLGNDTFKFINDKLGNDDRYINQNYSGNLRKDLKDNVLNQDTLDAFISASLTSAIFNGANDVMTTKQKNQMFQEIAKEKNISVEKAKQDYENEYKAQIKATDLMQEVDKKYDLTKDERNDIKVSVYNTLINGKDVTEKYLDSLIQTIKPVTTQETKQTAKQETLEPSKEVKSIKYSRKRIRNINNQNENIKNEIKEIRDIRKNSQVENKSIKQEIKNINENTKTQVEPLKAQLKEVNENLKNVQNTLKKGVETNTKESQLETINKTNPMTDDYHTGIRSVEDIRTFDEAYNEAKGEAESGEYENYSSYPDVTNEMLENAMKKGTIKVFSSKPIKDGVFVTPSLQQATDYAGGKKVYSKNVKLSDVAWVNVDEGQYASYKTNEADETTKNILLNNANELTAKQQELTNQINEINDNSKKSLEEVNKRLEKSNNNLLTIDNTLLEKNDLLKQNKKKEKELNKKIKSNITKQVINSDAKITLDVADGSVIEATKGVDYNTKQGKKYEKKINNTKRSTGQKAFVSKGIGVEDLSNATGNKEMLYKYYERARSVSKAQYNIKEVENNVFNKLKTEQQKKDFAEYTYLKLNAERLKKGKSGVWTGESAIDEKTSKQMANELETKYPEFKELSKKLYDYLGKQQQMLVDSGFASEDASEYFYETYVPTIRELAGSKNTSPLLNNARKSGLKSPIRSAKGSEREIVDLEKAIALTTIRNQRAVDENNARKELLNSVGGVVGGERLSFDETHNTGNDYQMSVYKDGRVITMTVNQDIAEAYTPTKYYQIEELTGLKILRGMSKAQRGVLTQYSPSFLVTNLIKDSQDALINTKFNNLEYLANLPKAIDMMKNNSKEFQQYKKNGGYGVTYYDSKNETFRKENALTKVVDKYENISNNIEQVWRFNEYLLTKKNGGTESEAMYNASEVTTNFARGGDISKALDRNGALFLNASIQGFDKQIRNFKENGAKGAVRLLIRGALLSLPYIFNQATMGDDDKYKKISEYTKQNNYIVKVGDTYFKIPRGRALSVYTTALQDMLATASGKKKIMEALQSTGSSLVENIAPNNPLENNVLSPLIQAKNNTNYYGNKIVSDYLSQKPKEEQYDEKTDMISRYIGKAFNFSPKKVNYVIDQYTGWLGDAILPQLTPSTKDTSNILKKKFIVDTDTSNQSYFDLKSKQESYDKEVENIKDLSKATTEQRGKALSSKYIKDIKEEEISPLYKEIDNVRNNKNLDEKEKALQVEELYNKIYEISKSAIDDADAGVIYDDYAIVGHNEYRMIRNKDGEYVWSKISDDTLKRQEEYFTTYGITAQTYYSGDRINRTLIANNDKNYDKIKEDIENIKGEYKNSLDASKDEKNYNTKAKKREVFNYINNLDLTLVQKAMLMKQNYSSYDDYDKYIFDYVNNSDLTYDEKTMILLKNGFKYNSKTGTFK